MIKRLALTLGLLWNLTACAANPASGPAIPTSVIVTPIASPASTSEDTEIERCSQQATTQLAINECAGKKRDEMARQLEGVVKQVQAQYNPDSLYANYAQIFPQATLVPPETFSQLQTDWEAWTKRECVFRYGRIISDTTILFYEKGSMAPMLVASCETAKYKQRIDELRRLYLDKP